MTISNRETVCVVAKEANFGDFTRGSSTAQGTIAIQDGFTVEPSFNELENAELSGSIGQSRTELGTEAPTATFNHYLRSSGTEGVEANYGIVLEALLGSKVDALAEGALGASSTDRLLKTGTTAYERGHALLVKDSTNGYQIRNVSSRNGGDTTLAQKLSGAPASGTTLGRAVLYKPSADHPSVSLHFYRGNSGAIESVTGSLNTEGSIEITAGEYINGSFSFSGREYFFDAIVIPANTVMDISGTDYTVPARAYKDPHDLAAALQNLIRTAPSQSSATCVYLDGEGKFDFTFAGTGITSDFSGSNNIGQYIGITDDVDTAATTIKSTDAISLSLPYSVEYDSETPLVAKDSEILLGGVEDIACFQASTCTITVSNEKTDSTSICAASGISSSRISARTVEIEISALLNQYDAGNFRRFRTGQETIFAGNFGKKSGGRWVPGRCVNLFSPTTTITSYTLEDADGLVQLNMTLRAYVDNGRGEFYINTL